MDIPYEKIIIACSGIYRITHLVMGKTTSKKALSCAGTQGGANPKLGRSSTGLNLGASARHVYTNVESKLGSEAN